ncbi:MAG TPA: hypothetical protein VF218_09090 [Acidothermaceae bacterium]|jgi:hypothetical protein
MPNKRLAEPAVRRIAAVVGLSVALTAGCTTHRPPAAASLSSHSATAAGTSASGAPGSTVPSSAQPSPVCVRNTTCVPPPNPADVPAGPAPRALPAGVAASVRVVDPWLTDGHLAQCPALTPDGLQLVCAELLPSTSGQDKFLGLTTVDVAAPHTAHTLYTATSADAQAALVAVSSDADWIVWSEDRGNPNEINNTDWAIYAYNRATRAVHLVSQASPADVAKHIDMPTVQPALANGKVWWAATTTGSDGQVRSRVFAAPVAGGDPALVANDGLFPQPVDGNGDGPHGTTVYAEGPDAAHTAAVLRRIDASGTMVPTNAGDRDISALAAGKAGLAWELLSQQVVIYYQAPQSTTPVVVGSLGVQPTDNPAELGADLLGVADRYVVWSQSTGGMVYDTTTNTLYKVTDYDYPVIATNGGSVVWGVAPPASDHHIKDPLALRYFVLPAQPATS